MSESISVVSDWRFVLFTSVPPSVHASSLVGLMEKFSGTSARFLHQFCTSAVKGRVLLFLLLFSYKWSTNVETRLQPLVSFCVCWGQNDMRCHTPNKRRNNISDIWLTGRTTEISQSYVTTAPYEDMLQKPCSHTKLHTTNNQTSVHTTVQLNKC